MRSVQILGWLVLTIQFAVAQTTNVPQNISESDARQHLVQHTEPIYPPIARAAQVQGDVVIRVTINESGQVVSEKIVSGPPMLLQAALDGVKDWRFTPFQVDGTPTQVITTLTIPFHLETNGPQPTAAQEQAAQEWFSLSEKCRKSLSERNEQDSLDFCKEALEIAMKAGDLTPSDQLAMLDSHEGYGRALLIAGKLQEALAEEDKAIAVARVRLTDTDQEYAMPFYWRALVEADLGDSDAASADFSIAEETHRKAIASLPAMKKIYAQYLANILNQHAALLDQMGRAADAAELRAEAASL